MAPRVAVLVLACQDYAAFELAMAAHAKYLQPDVPFYILQNCSGTYDAERTRGVAHRYANLYPRTIKVIDDLSPAEPYANISRVLACPEFRGFDFVCKVDDDAFPIREGWLNDLLDAWLPVADGGRYAYATPLINNNKWGFTEVMRIMGLEEEYFSHVARDHVVGRAVDGGRIISASEIDIGTNGTIWGYPYIARWIHRHTSFRPDDYVAATRGLPTADIPGDQRYSIGCILFRRTDWLSLNGDSRDDEHRWHMRCLDRKLDLLCVRAVPFVHLAYFTHREENRDVVDDLKELYRARFDLPFPISLHKNPIAELEARLRWLEDKLYETTARSSVQGDDTDSPRIERHARKRTLAQRLISWGSARAVRGADRR